MAEDISTRRRSRLLLNLAAVLLISAAALSYGIDHSGIAAAYSDSIAHIRAQDESVYAHISLRLAERGGWLTPVYMGRFLLQKPPLLVWASGLSIKLFGPTLTALRAPSLLAAIAATGLIFFWVAQSCSFEAAWTTAALLLSNPLWHTLARLAYMDMLFALWVISAMYCLHRDPALEQRRFRLAFAVCTAAAIMTKSVAGLIPVLVLALAALISRAGRPRWARMAQAGAMVAAIVAPWHLYQLVVHPRWFWADYVQVQLIGFGSRPPAQSSDENQAWFYFRRLWESDPVLMAMALLALFPLLRELYRGRSGSRASRPAPSTSLLAGLLTSWIAVVVGALLAFRYRNFPYALYLIPPLAILAGVYFPAGAKSSPLRWLRLVALSVVFLVKATHPAEPWGLPLGSASPIPAAAALRSYAAQKRPDELIVVSPEDEFYAATLALPKVRYAFADPSGVVASYAPHYVYLGITLTLPQFLRLPDLESEYLTRLRHAGMNSGEALGTAIILQSEADTAELIEASPGSDFLLPNRIGESLPPAALAGHSVTKTEAGWFVLAGRPTEGLPAVVFTRAPSW